MARVRKRVAVLISGRGSNLAALLRAARHPDYPAEIVLVISNNPDASGLKIAGAAGVTTAVINHRPYRKDRAGHETAIAAALDAAKIDLICLAGYMRLFTATMVQKYKGRILNIHPSLLPAFPGLDTHARALAAGVKLHGCTVHGVTDKVDDGPILAQAAVPVLPGDTEAALADRVLAQEHVIYARALALFASGEAGTPPEATAALVSPLPPAPTPA